MKNSLETRLGVFFALAFIAAAIVFEMAGGAGFMRGGYRINGLFANAQELKVGDAVKLAGVPIGKVEKIGFEQDKVKVTMKLDRDSVVRTDAKATIKFAGLMGQNFVSVSMGSPTNPKFEDGGVIQTVEQPDLSALMAKLESVATGVENVTKSFSGDSIQNILGPLTDFMKDNRNNLTLMIANMKAVSQNIAEGQGTVGKLIKDEALYNSALTTVSNLNATADDIKATINEAKGMLGDAKAAVTEAKDALGEAKKVVVQINEGKGTVGRLIKDEKLYNETTDSMTYLKEILQKINGGQGTVGKLVNDDSFLKNVKMTLQKVDKATEGLEDQGPLSVLGIAVNSLF
jgi:phospholipid/cholesterol/gamma-HCH transport system substrate-binding protein